MSVSEGELDVYSGMLKHMTTSVQFALTSSEFRWWPNDSAEEGCMKIPVVDMISVTSSDDEEQSGGMLQICFAQRQKSVELRRVKEDFYGSIAVCSACAERLQKCISEDIGRPRRALVIISPLSGLCKGKQLYEERVAPLFKEAGVQTDVKEIQRPLHAKEIVSQYDITKVDSVVVVAGDGTYCEVINSLLRNHNTSRADDVSEPSAIHIPIGLIPTGTGNVIGLRCYGTLDVETAALTIISGKRKRTGVFGVYSDGRLVTYAGFSVAYGVFSDFMYMVSSKRDRTSYFSLPLAMYRMMAYLLFGEIRQMDMTVKYARSIPPGTDNTLINSDKISATLTSANASATAPDENRSSQSQCSETVGAASLDEKVDGTTREKADDSSDSLQWSTKSGSYTAINTAFSFDVFAFDKSEGIQPGGATRLRLQKPSSRWQLVKSVYQAVTFQREAMKIDANIDHDLASEYIVKINNASDPSTERGQKELRLAIDGDIVDLPVPEFHVKLLDGKVDLFCNI